MRIVENLVVNAVKHTPAETTISVRVENRDGGVLIAVDDRGPGVDESRRDAIFQLFTRGDEVVGVPGAGVGLSLVSQFAALHGGRAWVRGKPRRRGLVPRAAAGEPLAVVDRRVLLDQEAGHRLGGNG